jgi:23S rRNA pseudouridine955/2504/2580 synthase
VLNKPAGLAVHGEGSLDTLAQDYLAGRLPPSLSFRPGPLHRLDKPSSGVIVFSTSLEGARFFSSLLRSRRIRKHYLAVVEGRITAETHWEDDLARNSALRKTFVEGEGGPFAAGKRGADNAKAAVTKVFPLASSVFRGAAGNSAYTLIRAEIETGRTHQIRAQAAAHGYPLAGDRKYGACPLKGGRGHPGGGGFLLHAWRISFPEGAGTAGHARESAAGEAALPRSITAPLPGAFRRRVEELFGLVEGI